MKYNEFYRKITKKETALSENASIGIEVTVGEWRIFLDLPLVITETDFRYLIKEMAEMDYYLCNVQYNKLIFSTHELYHIND